MQVLDTMIMVMLLSSIVMLVLTIISLKLLTKYSMSQYCDSCKEEMKKFGERDAQNQSKEV